MSEATAIALVQSFVTLEMGQPGCHVIGEAAVTTSWEPGIWTVWCSHHHFNAVIPQECIHTFEFMVFEDTRQVVLVKDYIPPNVHYLFCGWEW